MNSGVFKGFTLLQLNDKELNVNIFLENIISLIEI